MAVAASLLLLVLAANVLVWQYGRGAVRAALDEGVRAGSRAPATAADCQARADDALADLLGGSMGRSVTLMCSETPDEVMASADVHFRGWLPLMPDWSFSSSSSAVKEQEP